VLQGPLGRVVQNVIQKDWDLIFLIASFGLMILLDELDEKFLPGMVPRFVTGSW
jgi:hypothetical protein